MLLNVDKLLILQSLHTCTCDNVRQWASISLMQKDFTRVENLCGRNKSCTFRMLKVMSAAINSQMTEDYVQFAKVMYPHADESQQWFSAINLALLFDQPCAAACIAVDTMCRLKITSEQSLMDHHIYNCLPLFLDKTFWSLFADEFITLGGSSELLTWVYHSLDQSDAST